jgi:hypothetical protein
MGEAPLVVSSIDLIEETDSVLTILIHGAASAGINGAILRLDRHLVAGVMFGKSRMMEACAPPRAFGLRNTLRE